MRKCFWVLFSLVVFPTLSYGYIGVDLGAVDKDKLGYGLSFGGSLPMNLGIDVQLVGYYKTEVVGKTGWIQANGDLFYDFNSMWKNVSDKIELHPYLKGGFTYGAFGVNAGASTSTEFSKGPGFNFGGGVDWKLLPFLTVGFDLSGAWVFLSGITVAGVTSPSHTAKVFNALGVVKFFAY